MKTNGQTRGYFVARKDNEGFLKIGYSVCHPDDYFNKQLGLNFARSKSTRFYKALQNRIREEWKESLDTFIDRAKRYFKDAKIVPSNQ